MIFGRAISGGDGPRSKSALVCLCALILFLSAFRPAPAHADQAGTTITLVTILSPDSELGVRLGRLYAELFNRLDMKCVVVPAPPDRACLMLEMREADGDLLRGREHISPHLVMVEEPVVPVQGVVALTTDPDYALGDLDDLKGAHIRISCQQGMAILRDRLEEYVAPEHIIQTCRNEVGLRQLIAGRVDLYVAPYVAVEALLHRPEYKDVRVAGVVFRTEGHLFLRNDLAALLPKVTETLRELKRDGSYAAIMGGIGFDLAAKDKAP